MTDEPCTCPDDEHDPACPVEADADFAAEFGAKRAGEREAGTQREELREVA